jgi:predicted O-methyltransferase YrrM
MVTTPKRFAAHILLFDSKKLILKMLENCDPFVEKIYVAYSKVPWSYNPQARDDMTNTADLSILMESKYADKIEIIHGVWDWEHDQRNACLKKAKEDGFDFLLVQDADEFYTTEAYGRMIEDISSEPDYDCYETPWCNFWKSWDYILVNEAGSSVHGYRPNVAMNCKRDIWFTSHRGPGYAAKVKILNSLCFHGSYVLEDEEVYRKINSWGHALDFDREAWYSNKWLNWSEGSEDLHPTHPYVWKRAVKFTGALPEVLRNDNATTTSIRKVDESESPNIDILKHLSISYWLHTIQTIDGWLSYIEQIALLHIPLMVNHLDGAIVEIGSYKGKSTACLAIGSTLFTEKKKKVFAIDPFVISSPEEFRNNIEKIELPNTIISIPKFSTEAYEDCPDSIAALFIDGDHSYWGVKHDIDYYAVRVVPGGIVAFHDYTNSLDVKQAVDEMCRNPNYRYLCDYDSMRIIRRIG